MEKHDFDIEKIVDQVGIDDEPRGNHKDRLRWEMLKAFNSSDTSRPVEYKWSFIMNSKIIKYAAAAVVLVAVMLSLTVMEKSTPVAMADIMEAMHSVRYLHLKILRAGLEDVDEAWIQFDHMGNVQNIRMQIYSQTEGAAEGLKVAVWKEGKAKVWIKEKNVLMTVSEQESADQILNAVTKLDPKHAIENVYEGEAKGDLVLDFQEPSNKIDPIIIDVEVPVEGRLLVLSIDQATKLLSSFEIHMLENGEYKYKRTIEYHDYNQPIDPAMFVLEDEIPEDAIVIDETIPVFQGAGLEQGELNDEDVAVKVVRQLFNALISKDYSSARVLWPSVTTEQLEQFHDRWPIVKFSIGEPTIEPGTEVVKVPCVLTIEKDGQLTELPMSYTHVKEIKDQPGRWVVMGGF